MSKRGSSLSTYLDMFKVNAKQNMALHRFLQNWVPAQTVWRWTAPCESGFATFQISRVLTFKSPSRTKVRSPNSPNISGFPLLRVPPRSTETNHEFWGSSDEAQACSPQTISSSSCNLIEILLLRVEDSSVADNPAFSSSHCRSVSRLDVIPVKGIPVMALEFQRSNLGTFYYQIVFT
ncbi:hypothetical protein Taro_006597 [Colocasia esculenta]|uniref:Uncharacterized protein n=1 Tax=Colocasia esculenta TaxID=4460 RepID=A0A843TWI1_COLES|nr:hypothetical protein [Colocasia esculenta]